MNDFQISYLPAEAFDWRLVADKFSVSKNEAMAIVERNREQSVWLNDKYQVNARYVEPKNGWPALIHLSIKRIDKETIHDWRELQEIKNKLVGLHNEGVEIYPDDDRLVDSANQYHLWVLADPTIKLPFGFGERLTATPEQAASIGAKQR